MGKLTDIEQLRRRRKRINFIKSVVVLTLLFVIVLMVLYFKNSREFGEFLGENLFHFAAPEQQGSFPVSYNTKASYQMTLAENGNLGVLDQNSFRIYNQNGALLHTQNHQYVTPRGVMTSSQVLLYDMGGKGLQLFSSAQEYLNVSLDYPIYSADLLSSGIYALAGGAAQDASQITVTDRDRETVLFRWLSTDKYVSAIRLNENGREMLAATVEAENGSLTSRLYLFRFSQQEEVAQIPFEDQLILSMEYKDNGSIAVVTDKGLWIYSSSGKLLSQEDFGNEPLNFFDNSLPRHTAVVLGQYSDNRKNRILIYSSRGTLSGECSVEDRIQRVRSDQNCLYIQTQKGIYQFSTDGQLRQLVSITNILDFIPSEDCLFYVTSREIGRCALD